MKMIAAILAISICPLMAAEYFVATNGNDAAPGSKGEPFRTIQRGMDALKAGDTCYVREGRYREAVTARVSGVAGKPVRLAAYPGEVVVLDGTEPVKGEWILHKGAIYKTKMEADIEQLFVDGEMMMEARWPNTTRKNLISVEGWAAPDKGSEYGRIIDADLAKTGIDWTGATAFLCIGNACTTFKETVKHHSAGSDTVEYEKSMGFEKEVGERRGEDGWRLKFPGVWLDSNYYLIGKLEALDAPGEWFLDKKTRTLYFWAPDGGNPSRLRLERKARDYAIRVESSKYFRLDGFHFFGSTFRLMECEHCVVENCHLRFPSYAHGAPKTTASPGESPSTQHWFDETWPASTRITGTANIMRNCSLAWGHTGVSVGGSSNLVENCLLHDINWNGTFHYFAVGPWQPISFTGIIRRNTIFNTGYGGVYSHDGMVELNHIWRAGILSRDVDCFYDNNTVAKNGQLRFNWVHDNPNGGGLRPDDGPDTQRAGIASDIYIHHNVAWNCSTYGILSKGDGNRVYNNTCFSNKQDIVIYFCPAPNTLTINNYASGKKIDGPPPTNQAPGELSHNYTGEDPRLVDPSRLDFRPRSDSPLVDAGRVVPGLTTNYVGKAPDIGAYEFGGERWLPGHFNGVWVVSTGSRGGGVITLRVTLNMPPVRPVTVKVSSKQAGFVLERGDHLTFTDDDWMQPREITVRAAGSGAVPLVFEAGAWGAAQLNNARTLDTFAGVRIPFEYPDLVIDRIDLVKESGPVLPFD